MFVSKDNGKNWQQVMIKDKKTDVERTVNKVVWGVKLEEGIDPGRNPDTKDTIYFTYGAQQITDPILQQCKSFVIYTVYSVYCMKYS